MSKPRWPRGAGRYAGWLAVALAGLVLAGCQLDAPRSAMDPRGPVAQGEWDLFMLTFWWGLAVFAVVTGALVYAIWRYRRRPDQEGIPEQIHGEMRLEIAWTVLPAVILVIIGIPTVQYIFETQSHVDPTDEDLHVVVTGYQWWWRFDYPQLGITTANELHIPTDRRVVLDLRSADVLHAFWVPKLSGKVDLIPNQDNQLWFVASEPGEYLGHCAEFCLTAHAYMRFMVVAHDEPAFEEWAATWHDGPQAVAQVNDALVGRGASLFLSKGCAGCHMLEGVTPQRDAPAHTQWGRRQTNVGPDLTNFGERRMLAAAVAPNTAEYLYDWLENPQRLKPGNYMPDLGLTHEEIEALVAYLMSLGRDGEATAGVAEATASVGGTDGNR